MQRLSFGLLLIAMLSNLAVGQDRPDEPAESGSIEFASAARLDEVESELMRLQDLLDSGQLLEAGYSTEAAETRQDVPACERCPGLFVAGSFLYLKPRRSGLDFAISDPNTDDNIEGPVESLELESNTGLRFELGYQTASGWDLAATYTLLETNAQRAISEPAGGRLWMTRSAPASFNNHADNARASASLDYNVLDLDARYWLFPTSATAFQVFGGVRAATIEEQLSAVYQGGTVLGTRVQTSRTQVDAIGLRAGVEGHWRLGNRFSVFSRLAGAVLVGDFSTSLVEHEAAFGVGDVNVSHTYYDALPVLEAAAGANWQRGRFGVQCGYEATAWLNLDQRTGLTGAEMIGRGNLTSVPNDLLLDGLFLRLSYTR